MADQGNVAQRLGSGQPRMRTGGSGMATTGSAVPARIWARWVATAWFHALGLGTFSGYSLSMPIASNRCPAGLT